MFSNSSSSSSETTACVHGYEFHFEGEGEWNVVSEWGLVCDRAFIAPLVTTVYFCGVMVGGVVFGSLSDRCDLAHTNNFLKYFRGRVFLVFSEEML